MVDANVQPDALGPFFNYPFEGRPISIEDYQSGNFARLLIGTWRGDWAASTNYEPGDFISYNDEVYATFGAHTSTDTFDSSRWVRIFDPNPYESVRVQAEAARDAALAAQAAAELAQGGAETAQTGAQGYATTASGYATAAGLAQTASEAAQTAAEAAQVAAELAQTGAETAETNAETAETNAAASAADAAAAAQAAIDAAIGDLSGQTLKFARVNAGEDGFDYRTAAEVQTALESSLIATARNWNKIQHHLKYTVSYAASVALNLEQQMQAEITLTGDITFAEPTNGRQGGVYQLLIIQDGSGGHAVTWNSVFKFAEGTVEIDDAAGGMTLVTFRGYNPGSGMIYLATSVKSFASV